MSLFPGPREDGLCLGLNFNISKVGYSFLLKVHAFLQVDFLEDEFQCTKKQKKTVVPSAPFYRNQSHVQSGRIFTTSETLQKYRNSSTNYKQIR